ncbi:HWE histidine kinase domain-containing protein [Azospirillum picis]|uniref:histidine kinase n=1 Tax=Azospirillum picis TaxID=488438 RepID=A0ABU0MJ25_9PROT|nr:HWE histidine kinase domain-containing protein [Azospirillum picis]MBP2299413.1 light-regulated signal transduction histidine kinase (bacteriophytochrome) [Azospirillum picis]MDQ0533460.1 light-regulated signal transduction histidine kinase (bacteriophytochrome) [Azospirillum picis]
MSSAVPAGSVDLTDCDREPIHQLGLIQPTGFLVAVTADWIILHASANVGRWLGAEPEELLGTPLSRVITPEALHTIRGRLQIAHINGSVERAFGVHLSDTAAVCDVAVHLSGSTIVIEAEPSEGEGPQDSGSLLRSMIARIQNTRGFDAFCREAARQMRALTGFDRVMVYRFASDGSGEVIAESAVHGIGSFLGQRYPASDIPQQARRLYERNWLRCIADVNAPPVPIVPVLDPTGQPLDLSLSMLRSVSLIHVEYLRNMGVNASLSVSILRHGKLWGLFACHHRQARALSFERRTTAELFGQMASLLLEGREREQESQNEAQVRRVHVRIMSMLADSESPLDSLVTFATELRTMIQCDGFACCIDDHLHMEGETPTREETLGVMRFLHRTPPSKVYVTDNLGAVHPPARDFTARACGLLAIPVSRTPRDYLVFFRKEVVRTVTWGGDPSKPAHYGPNGPRLTPRKSFEAWKETVHGQSQPWSDLDQRSAESLRVTLLEVVLRLADVAGRTRKEAGERQELLIAELNHRVRNILSLVRALVRQSESGAETVQQFAGIVAGRIEALARAHDQITADNWGPASLRALITAEIGAYLSAKNERVRLTGPEVLLAPQAFSVFALVVHELTTNSAKYGALSDSSGWVEVDWSMGEDGRLLIDWQENGGPPVRAPTRTGFGTTVIERSVPHDLRGEAEVTYALPGLRARFMIPATYVTISPALLDRSRSSLPAPAADFTIGGPVLLLEDNMIIAMATEDVLLSFGASRVNTAAGVRQAQRLIDDDPPVVGVLDINLGSETSVAVADRLRELGIPFVFATGYGDSAAVPERFAGVPVLKKPYGSEQVVQVLAAVLG